ncbi:MAG TPA: homocysteine S-methyltransferase family protein [Fimbriimonas sp.]|nr:homocysteine S-methyltransferase family protein [Fimbriimonas sp.]
MSESHLLDVLQDHVLIYDGAMGTQLQAANLTAEDFRIKPTDDVPTSVREAADRVAGKSLEGCNEFLVYTRPDVVSKIHGAYLEAGSDLVESNTFGSTSIVLAEYGLEDIVYEISLQAGKLAKEACVKHSTPEKPRFAVGAIGPGTRLVSLGQTTWEELERTYSDSFRGLLEGGVDALLLETLQDLLMTKACIVAAERAMAETGRKVPLFVQVTMEQTGTMLLGSEIGAAINMLEAFPSVKSIGINCATGPVEMAPHIRFLGQHSTRPLSVQPNAGLPVLEQGQAKYKLTPEELADHHERFIEEHGAALVGGCCGTTPAHIRAVAERVGGKKHSADAQWRRVQAQFPGFDFEIKTPEQSAAFSLVGCSSLYQFQPYHQESSFLIVGERTNANGSKLFREQLARENWEALTELGRDCEKEGAHVLDVCTAYVGRDERKDMTALLERYNRHITVPLMIDSTEWQVTEAALQHVAGKPILNSINFEDGEGKAAHVLGLARKYGAAVVGLTIDEDGMARGVEKKLEIADRLIQRVRAAGLPDHDLFIDFLTFTLAQGDEESRKAGMDTVNAIAELKKRYPRVNTVLGVSNISFGLKPAIRQVLNSAFLHYCREAGLTSAIVDIAKIRPESQIDPGVWEVASDLVYDRRRFAAA